MNKLVIVIVSALLLIGAFVVGLYVMESTEEGAAVGQAEQNAASLVREHSPRAGDADARVTIVEFFDPACGTCRAFHPIVKDIMRSLPGRVNLVTRYMPLHPGAEEVVRILEAARLQGKYWETLEAGYRAQPRWAINHQAHANLFWQSVASVGLDQDRVAVDMRSDAVTRNIQLDIEDGRRLGVDKTPGFFVNGKPLLQFGERQLRDLVMQEVQREYGN
jgi:protein-disulfide isomerase